MDKAMRDLQSKVGDSMLDYLRNERLPKGQPTKLLMKKIGRLKILHKFGNNVYEVEAQHERKHSISTTQEDTSAKTPTRYERHKMRQE